MSLSPVTSSALASSEIVRRILMSTSSASASRADRQEVYVAAVAGLAADQTCCRVRWQLCLPAEHVTCSSQRHASTSPGASGAMYEFFCCAKVIAFGTGIGAPVHMPWATVVNGDRPGGVKRRLGGTAQRQQNFNCCTSCESAICSRKGGKRWHPRSFWAVALARASLA